MNVSIRERLCDACNYFVAFQYQHIHVLVWANSSVQHQPKMELPYVLKDLTLVTEQMIALINQMNVSYFTFVCMGRGLYKLPQHSLVCGVRGLI